MPARRILQLGDPLLRAVSTPVGEPSAARLVFQDLRATLHEFRRTHGFGRGISAIQIGEPKRLIYIEFEGAAYAIRNPEYELRSEAKFRLWDDCFSFPGLLVYLERSETVRVRYEDEEGGVRRLKPRARWPSCCSTKSTTWMESWQSTARSTATVYARARNTSGDMRRSAIAKGEA